MAKEVGVQFIYIGNLNPENTNQTYCPSCTESIIISRKGYAFPHISLNSNQCQMVVMRFLVYENNLKFTCLIFGYELFYKKNRCFYQ